MSQNDFRGKVTLWTESALPTMDIGVIFWTGQGEYEWDAGTNQYVYVSRDGLPRFTPYVWGGRADAMPEGDTQSSGQQLPEVMYPGIRAHIIATQLTTTEGDWQANPLKRLTHWSLGETGWVRPPDKNCVQPGSTEGAFYAAGVGSSSPLLGTAVLDQLQGHNHEVWSSMSVVSNTSSGQVPMNIGSLVKTNMVAATMISDPVNGDPRIGKQTRPRTWYGVWLIRMYGRITNPGSLDAAGVNTRMDMMDARIALLEARKLGLGDGQTYQNMTASRVIGGVYTNLTGRPIMVRIVFEQPWPGSRQLNVDGAPADAQSIAATLTSAMALFAIVPAGSTYGTGASGGTFARWMELR